MATRTRAGRPKLPEGQKKVLIGVSLRPADLTRVDNIASHLGMSRSGVISLLLQERLDKWTGIKITSHIDRENL